MKIFYLFSNWKWTGPAEPALNLAWSLKEEGMDLSFFPGLPPKGDPALVGDKALEKGLSCPPGLTLKKHINLYYNFSDYWALQGMIRRESPQILHCNLTNDHFLATLCRGKNKRIKIVRSCYDDSLLKGGRRTSYILRQGTDHLATISEGLKKTLEEKHPFLQGKISTMEVEADLERFSPDRPLPDFRSMWGLEKDMVVVGMVARIQKHRKFDLFLETILEVSKKYPQLRVVVVGRGTHAEEVAREPVQKMGLEKVVLFPGYMEGDDFVGALHSFDIKVLMVPGSDGSCRAVREAMAMGKPLLVGNQGILPELIEKSGAGEVFEYNKDSLSEKLTRMIEDSSLRARYSKRALSYARENFWMGKRARQIINLYKELL